MNRGDHRQTLFWTPADYDAFIAIVREACAKFGMRILAYVLMPNHWHFVLWPANDGDLTRFVGWISMVHALRWKRVHGTWGEGPVYQGRFKAIPVGDDGHLVVTCAYVERNSVRAGLVADAREWRWSSACDSGDPSALRLSPWPIPRPANWIDIVNRPERPRTLRRLRRSVTISAPFGTNAWRTEVVERLGWRTGVRPPGRPCAVHDASLAGAHEGAVPAEEVARSLPDLHVEATPARHRFPDAHGGDAGAGEGAVDSLRMLGGREDEQPP